MNPDNVQMFEITEYLVNLNQTKIYRNTDLIDDFGRKLADTWSHTKIEPYQLQHVLPSASANDKFIG